MLALHGAFPNAVSHGICPDCIRALYPEIPERLLEGLQAEPAP